MTLDAAGSADIGLYQDRMFLSLPGFGVGVVLAVFHILPVQSDRLRRLERGNTVLQACSFRYYIVWIEKEDTTP